MNYFVFILSAVTKSAEFVAPPNVLSGLPDYADVVKTSPCSDGQVSPHPFDISDSEEAAVVNFQVPRPAPVQNRDSDTVCVHGCMNSKPNEGSLDQMD